MFPSTGGMNKLLRWELKGEGRVSCRNGLVC
jgi:hypothetical protein